jgi:hypothetical protein
VPSGFVMLLLHQCASPLSRLEIGTEDLGARGAQLLADQRLGGLCLVAAALLFVWRIGGHHRGRYRRCPLRNPARSARGRSGLQSFAVTASSTAAKRSRAAARRAGTCSVGSSPAGGV